MDKPVETVEKSQIVPLFAGGRVLGIFAKDPQPGEVKTRLCPPFTPEEAAEFYRLALVETVGAMTGGPFSLVLCHSGEPPFFRRNFPGLLLQPQGEGDLGARMERTLRRLLAGGARAAALIGSDTPDLPHAMVEEAFAALAKAEVVTVPARDGGYVLIGVRQPCPELFADIPWSSATVLSDTRRRAASLGIKYVEIGGWEDIDDRRALERLLVRSPDSTAARYAAGVLACERLRVG